MRQVTGRVRVLSVAILVLIGTGAIQAEEKATFSEIVKLLGNEVGSNDLFSRWGLDASGDTIVVGASGDDDLGTDAGAAYVFRRHLGGPDAWGQAAKLTAEDGAEFDAFGTFVAVSGDTVVVGAHEDDDQGNNSGSVYVFQRDAGGLDSWGKVAKITAADGADRDWFGESVAISGDTLVVGAEGDDDLGDRAGSAYIFERHAGGQDAWGQVAKITADYGGPDDAFGFGVSVNDDTVVVGAFNNDDVGAAYVFLRDAGGPDAWGQVAKLTAADGAPQDQFGFDVSVSGDTVVVGANTDDDLGLSSGSAYVFERDAGGPGTWGQVAKLTAGDGAANDDFGFSVAVSDKTVVVGAHDQDALGSESGAAYVFQREAGGSGAWGQMAKLTAADGAAGDDFGWSVAASGETVVVGAHGDDDLGDSSGSARIFESTLIDPLFTLSGTCPGEMTLSGFGFTPRGRVELYAALGEGTDVLGNSACIGTELGLSGAVLLADSRTDKNGSVVGIRGLSKALCPVYLQVLDLTSCTASNVVWIQSPGPMTTSETRR